MTEHYKRMKTPEEIKKGLEIEIAVHYHLPNPEPRLTPREFMYMEQLHADALTYITHLEQRLAQAERERDAAVKDIPRACGYCKNYLGGEHIPHCNAECMNISGINTGWQWRGVVEENSKEENNG